MQLNSALYRNGIVFFGMFFAVALWGFWSSYYSNPMQLETALHHVHGITMTLWCVMLIGQAYLIRTNRRAAHRLVGRTSYVLAPLIFAVTVALIRQALQDQEDAHLFLFYILGAAVLFATFYALAILNRGAPPTHARLMVCTVFPLYTAAADRILTSLLGGFTPAVPAAWYLGDLVLLALAIWDWRSHRRLNVFPFAFITMLGFHAAIFVSPQVPFWRTFTDWFLS
jgi:hypothetical protein